MYRTIDKILYLYKVLEEQKRAKESTKRKLKASEEKCSWSDDVIRNKFIKAPHQKQDHQKLKFIRGWKILKIQELELCPWSRPSFAKDWKSITMGLEKEFESIRCLFYQERWQRTIVRTVQPLPPLLCLCLYNKTRITALPAEMCLHTRNTFEIDPS